MNEAFNIEQTMIKWINIIYLYSFLDLFPIQSYFKNLHKTILQIFYILSSSSLSLNIYSNLM